MGEKGGLVGANWSRNGSQPIGLNLNSCKEVDNEGGLWINGSLGRLRNQSRQSHSGEQIKRLKKTLSDQ